MVCVIFRDFIIHFSRLLTVSGALPSWQSSVVKLPKKSLHSVMFGFSERLFHTNAGVSVLQNLGHFTQISASI